MTTEKPCDLVAIRVVILFIYYVYLAFFVDSGYESFPLQLKVFQKHYSLPLCVTWLNSYSKNNAD